MRTLTHITTLAMALLATGPAPGQPATQPAPPNSGPTATQELRPQYSDELSRYAALTLAASNPAPRPEQPGSPPSMPPNAGWQPPGSIFVRSTPSLVVHSGRAIRLIPGPNAVAEQMDDLATDLHIMSRIFDKEVLLAHGQIREGELRSWASIYTFPSTNLPSVLKSGSALTEALYIADYGAVFLMKSAFPLAQPFGTEAEQSDQEEGDTDPVWRRTWQELYAPEDARYKRGADETVAYDAEKVERLRTALLATVKHAANIRHLGDTDWVTVVVRGPRTQTRAYSRARSGRGDLSAIGGEPPAVPSPETVLRLRVRKADVDAFANRSLDKNAFQQRVDIVIY